MTQSDLSPPPTTQHLGFSARRFVSGERSHSPGGETCPLPYAFQGVGRALGQAGAREPCVGHQDIGDSCGHQQQEKTGRTAAAKEASSPRTPRASSSVSWRGRGGSRSLPTAEGRLQATKLEIQGRAPSFAPTPSLRRTSTAGRHRSETGRGAGEGPS